MQTLASNEGTSARWQPSHPGCGYISVQWKEVCPVMSSQHCKGPSLLSSRGTGVCHLHTGNYVVYVLRQWMTEDLITWEPFQTVHEYSTPVCILIRQTGLWCQVYSNPSWLPDVKEPRDIETNTDCYKDGTISVLH